MHSDSPDRLEGTQAQARRSPVRARILDLYEKNQDRLLTPSNFLEELTREGWQVTLAQVTYHVRRLADARLIPAPCRGS